MLIVDQELSVFFFFSVLSCCSKSGHQPQEDLAKSDYKTNAELENLGILLHVGIPLGYIWRFQKKKAKNLPKSSKNLGHFIIFILEM
jgi:hypothetical protein